MKASPTTRAKSKTPPQWRLAAADQTGKGFMNHHVDTRNLEGYLQDLQEEDSDDEKLSQAFHLTRSEHQHEARELAEQTLKENPASASALFVSAAECESRQDWAEAARFFLLGLSHNSSDTSMEHGFQTNVDMLRSNRNRHVERPKTNKWDEGLVFKPQQRQAETKLKALEKPPWYRLGPLFEQLIDNPGFLSDLTEADADPEAEKMELRRIIYQHLPFFNLIYNYYSSDLNETVSSDQSSMIEIEFDGHEMSGNKRKLKLKGFWRILKECKIAVGNARSKMPVAVFDRIWIQGNQRMAVLNKDATYDVSTEDPHDPEHKMTFYDFLEAIIRAASLKLNGTVSSRFENLLKDFLKPFAMRKQTEKAFLELRSEAVKGVLYRSNVHSNLRKIFEFFISSYPHNKIKRNVIGPMDLTMSLNHVYFALEKMEVFDALFNYKKCVATYCQITCDRLQLLNLVRHGTNTITAIFFLRSIRTIKTVR
eukprot:768272-Hanusia_phi.AAC.18